MCTRPDYEAELQAVLRSNPFTEELVKKWETDLKQFCDGSKDLSALSFVLPSDEEKVVAYQQNEARRKKNYDSFLHPEILPQPFIGDPHAPVWLLLLNPGYSSPDIYDHLGICPCCDRIMSAGDTRDVECMFGQGRDRFGELQKRQRLMLNQLRLVGDLPFYILDQSFNNLPNNATYKKKGGYRWWRAVLFGVRGTENFLLHDCDVGEAPMLVGEKLFVLESCPYHSKNFNSKVLWDGNKYTEFWKCLIAWAVRAGKKFIVRSSRVDQLLRYSDLDVNEGNSVHFSNVRNVTLTDRNLQGQMSCEVARIFRRRTLPNARMIQ